MSNRQTAVDAVVEDGEVILRRSDGDIIAQFSAGEGGSGSTSGISAIQGTGLPTNSLGNEGDIYISSDTDTMYGPKIPPGTPYQVRMGEATTFVTGLGSGSFGNEYTFNITGQITGVRFYRDVSEQPKSRSVRVYSAGTLLTTSVASNELAGQSGWIDLALPAPINVVGGQKLIFATDFVSRLTPNQVTPPRSELTQSAGLSGTAGGLPAGTLGYFQPVDITYMSDSNQWPVSLIGFPDWMKTLSFPDHSLNLMGDADQSSPALKVFNPSGIAMAQLYAYATGGGLDLTAPNASAAISIKATDTSTSIAIKPLSTQTGLPSIDLIGGYIRMKEIGFDPASPPLDGACLYLKDNGSGKTQLWVRFNGGTTVLLETQP
jgi:hypothetical protein